MQSEIFKTLRVLQCLTHLMNDRINTGTCKQNQSFEKVHSKSEVQNSNTSVVLKSRYVKCLHIARALSM